MNTKYVDSTLLVCWQESKNTVFSFPKRHWHFVLFTWNCINDNCLVAVDTLSTRSIRYFFVYSRQKRNIYLSCCRLAFKGSIVPFSYFEASNTLSGTLFLFFFFLNTCFLVFFEVQIVIASPTPVLLHFNLEKHHSYFAFSFFTTIDLFCCLFWGF